MNGSREANKRKLRGNRIVGALLKGIVWGWAISFVISIAYWCLYSFDMANNRLSNMVHAEALIEGSYSNPLISGYITVTTKNIKKLMQKAERRTDVKEAAGQIRNGVNSVGSNGYMKPTMIHIRSFLSKWKVWFRKLFVLLKNNSLMVLGKLLLLTLALPLLVLSWIFGVVDGFTLREVRTAELGRESSFIFHRFLGFIPQVLWVLVAAYVVVPLWINPILFFVCASLLVLMLTSKTVSKFKKYV